MCIHIYIYIYNGYPHDVALSDRYRRSRTSMPRGSTHVLCLTIVIFVTNRSCTYTNMCNSYFVFNDCNSCLTIVMRCA